jgi:hypothetical protein
VRYVKKLRERGLTDRRGLYIKVGTNTYYSMVTFARWCDLEARHKVAVATAKKMGADETEYDKACDDSLVFPHASEIWSEEKDLSFVPTGMRLSDAVQLVIEDVKPTADYEAAWKPIAAALAQAKYPLERRTYFSQYGPGRVLSFWMAPSAAVAKAAPTVQQALTSAVGEARAAELVAGWRACVLATQTFAVEPRLDMSRD